MNLKKTFQIVAFAISTLGVLPSAMAVSPSARGKDLCPNWSKTGGMGNESYLVQTSLNSERTLNDNLFDVGASRALREEYEIQLKRDEARVNAGLTDQVEDKSRVDVFKEYAKKAVNAISKLRLKREEKNLVRAAKNGSLPPEPVAAAVLAASLYTGRSMHFKIFDTRVNSKMSVKNRVAEVTAPIGTLGTTATLAYNHDAAVCASDNGCALLAQPITSNVSAVLNSAEKGTARLIYSVSF